MSCIKCGKSTSSGAEFCEECLEEMHRYPVKSGTPVILPKREEYATTKHVRKKTVKPEVQIAHLKRMNRGLAVLSAVLLLLLAAAVVIIVRLMDGDPTSLLQ